MKQSEANEISLVCLVRPHRLALLSQGGPPACRSRHRAPPSPNAVMSVGIASESNAGGVKGMSPVAISPFSWRFRRGRRKRDVPSRLVGGPGTSLSGIDEDLKHPLAARLVLCPVGVGLTVEHLPIILDALRRPVCREFERAR